MTAADRPAGHDAHQQTAAEECPRPGCTPPPGGWCGLCPAIRRLIATAEQRGRDDVTARILGIHHVGVPYNTCPHCALSDLSSRLGPCPTLLALADRSEAAT